MCLISEIRYKFQTGFCKETIKKIGYIHDKSIENRDNLQILFEIELRNRLEIFLRK